MARKFKVPFNIFFLQIKKIGNGTNGTLNKAWDGFGPMNPYGSFVPEI